MSHPLAESGLTLLIIACSDHTAKRIQETLFQTCPPGRRMTAGPWYADEEADGEIATGRPVRADLGRPGAAATQAATTAGPMRQLLEDGGKSARIAPSKHGTRIGGENSRPRIALRPDTRDGSLNGDQPKVIATQNPPVLNELRRPKTEYNRMTRTFLPRSV